MQSPPADYGMASGRYTLAPVCGSNAAHVATVFRAIYGEDFPIRYVYDADLIMLEINEGRLGATIAFDETGAPAGYVSVFKCAPNPDLWEGGNLQVVPAHSRGNLANILMGYYMQPRALPGPRNDGIFGESVCHHYFTQLNCSKLGFADCALALDQLDAASFREHRPDGDRIACLFQFFEHSGPSSPIYLPQCYETILKRILGPLRPRTLLPGTAPLPVSGVTVRRDDCYEGARFLRVSVSSIGAGWGEMLDQLLEEARGRETISLQVVLPASLPYIDAAVEEMRQRGFFLGGIFPCWFGADGIMMQTVLGKEPDYHIIKLYTKLARELLFFIQRDRETVSGN